jgi:elongation factor P--beta-lysine ligase
MVMKRKVPPVVKMVLSHEDAHKIASLFMLFMEIDKSMSAKKAVQQGAKEVSRLCRKRNTKDPLKSRAFVLTINPCFRVAYKLLYSYEYHKSSYLYNIN